MNKILIVGKKMNKHIFYYIVLNFVCSLSADPVITLFLREYPNDVNHAQAVVNKLNKPGKIAQYKTKQISNQPTVAGIFSTYAGYLTASSYNGQITFPRKHDKPLLYLVITPIITPIIMFANTIHHWQLEPTIPAALFTCERKNDETTGLAFWEVKQLAQPENNIIPLQALVLIAKPQNFYVPEGVTVTHETENLLLPDVYVKKGINKLKNALYILDLSHFFSPEQFLYKKELLNYQFQPEP